MKARATVCKVCAAPRYDGCTNVLCKQHFLAYQAAKNERRRDKVPPSEKPETCCVEGCAELRCFYDGGKHSRFCRAHWREHNRQRRQANRIAPLTVADVCALWDKQDAAVFHDGRQVVGIRKVSDECYALVLMGMDETVLERAETALSRGGKP